LILFLTAVCSKENYKCGKSREKAVIARYPGLIVGERAGNLRNRLFGLCLTGRSASLLPGYVAKTNCGTGVKMTVKAERKEAARQLQGHLNKYSSVSICGLAEEICPAAKALARVRFLIDDAPALPLRKCSSASCNCKYTSYRDRRTFLSNRRSNSRLEARSYKRVLRGNLRAGMDRRQLKVEFRDS
jgi:hypothetical protein